MTVGLNPPADALKAHRRPVHCSAGEEAAYDAVSSHIRTVIRRFLVRMCPPERPPSTIIKSGPLSSSATAKEMSR